MIVEIKYCKRCDIFIDIHRFESHMQYMHCDHCISIGTLLIYTQTEILQNFLCDDVIGIIKEYIISDYTPIKKKNMFGMKSIISLCACITGLGILVSVL